MSPVPLAPGGRLLVTLICLAAGLVISPPVGGQGTANRAGLVIQHGDGTLFSACVAFDAPSISGLELLRRAGVSISQDSSGGLGTMICAVDGEGCNYPDENCLCQCQGASCTYWQYWHLVEGEWQYSSVGAAGWKVADRSVDGWVWGVGVPSEGKRPPATTFDEICTPQSTAAPPATSTQVARRAPALPAASVPVQTPTAPTPAPETTGKSLPASYVVFVAIVLILAALIARSLRRA